MSHLFRKWGVGSFIRLATSLARQSASPVLLSNTPPWLSLIAESPPAGEWDQHPGVEWIPESGRPVEDVSKARGTHVAFLRAGDILAPFALKQLQLALCGDGARTELLYGDALLVNRGRLPKPILKPAFDPVLLREIDYISNFAVYRRESLLSCMYHSPPPIIQSMSELMDCYLQGLDERQVVHLPYPLISTSHAPAKRLVQTQSSAKKATSWPQVTVVVPSRNGLEYISRTLTGILDQTDYPNLSVHVVDNGSDDPEVLALYRERQQRHDNFHYEINKETFNFSRSVNRGLARADRGHVLLLNNDVEMTDPGWLKEMVSCLDMDRAGIVGAKLLYPDDKLQHAGVIVGMGGLASHWYYKRPPEAPGHFGRLQARNSMVCVTGAVMLISRDCLDLVGLWDENNFAIAYNDVDYCLRAYRAGFRSIWTPHAVLYHHESATRAMDRSWARAAQFRKEKLSLKEIGGTDTFEDPTFSPWLSRHPGPFRFRRRKCLPPPRTWWDQA